MTNRLALQTSPYLRQHADNPVDWFPWGEEAFAFARDRNVPILLSVGYSACHWCHVMAHECFEDNEVALVMNSQFVNVKVDREERPDVDAIYMDAVQAMTGRGGWPMTVFLSPEGKPFFGGTYFPKASFLQLMNAITDAWHHRRADIDNNIEALMEALERTAKIEQNAEIAEYSTFDLAISHLKNSFDPSWGGFGKAPKFPSTMNIEVLLRQLLAGDDQELEQIVKTSLDAMASGGMYDHIGGGFSRYSVDEKWLVPHFEKMLYDQALLARTYMHAGLLFGNETWKQVAREVIEYVLRDLTHENGGFFSAEDADSLDESGHSHEGHFYVWSKEEITNGLPQDLVAPTLEWYEISESGNFEGANIPSRLHHRGELTRPKEIEQARLILFEQRNLRHRPLLDDKILTEWNAMMLSTLAEAAFVFNSPEWLQAAIRNGEFLVTNMRTESGSWMRSWQEQGSPQARHHALAADMAHLVDAFTRLAEASGQARWIIYAQETAEEMLTQCWDASHGGLFTTPLDGEQLIVRQKDVMDNATPSANSTAALALYRLGALTGNSRYTQHADQILRLLARIATSAPTAFGNLLAALHLRHAGITEVAIPGEQHKMLAELRSRWLPTVVLAWGEPYDSPLWSERSANRAYVCREYACMRPAESADEFVHTLRTALA